MSLDIPICLHFCHNKNDLVYVWFAIEELQDFTPKVSRDFEKILFTNCNPNIPLIIIVTLWL
jgi:hypothetical protein